MQFQRGGHSLYMDAKILTEAHTKGGGLPGMTRLRLAAISAFLLLVLGASLAGAQTLVASVDGTPWAGFHCAHTAACPGRLGIVGRLVSHPASTNRTTK